jgi:hypothetical protein
MSVISNGDYCDVIQSSTRESRTRKGQKSARQSQTRRSSAHNGDDSAFNLFANSYNKTHRTELITMPQPFSALILQPTHVSMSTSSLSDFSLTTFDVGEEKREEEASDENEQLWACCALLHVGSLSSL